MRKIDRPINQRIKKGAIKLPVRFLSGNAEAHLIIPKLFNSANFIYLLVNYLHYVNKVLISIHQLNNQTERKIMCNEWADDNTENYKEDLEELFCNDCKKSLGWNLPEMSSVFAVCHSCYYINGDEIRDMNKRKNNEEK